jgi:peptidoglycan/LPS O-acetylase OafA/YrhL
MKYRPELDGLRAIAVIAVILFHAGFRYFSGGFVGVDVFFVISGYLITSIILTDMERGTFSLLNFYERRARRILPALFLVIFVSLPCAWLWLRPPDLKDFAQSLVATSYFSSNILFWLQTGYWETASELKPLLHTWTLAIEGQYYLIFPIFLILIWSFQKRWILGSFILITTLSFAISQWGAYNLPSANFFLLPTRTWELLLGASIAFYLLYKKQPLSKFVAYESACDVLSLLGLSLIGYAIFAFDETIPFPSLFTLVPTAGTALILFFASPKTVVGQLLSTKYLVGIGLISYSAYLWHHPLLVFARHRSLTQPSTLLVISLVIVSFPLAYLSWKYVEQPFRSKGKINRKTILIFWLIGTIGFIEIGVAGILTNGFEGRLARRYPTPVAAAFTPNTINQIQRGSISEIFTPKSIDQIDLASLERNWESHRQGTTNDGFGLSKRCDGRFTLTNLCRTSEEPEILVWGDSFAMHLIPGILASNPDTKLIQMTKSVCGPFFDVAPISEPDYPVRWSRSCLEFTEKVRTWLRQNSSIKYVVMSSPFSQYILSENKLLMNTGDYVKGDFDFAVHEFDKTLTELKSLGLQPVVFSPPPANEIDLGRCLARAEWMGLSLDKCNFKQNEISQKRMAVYNFLDVIQTKHRVVRLDQLMCNEDFCETHLGQVGLYRDARHFSDEGSMAIGKKYDFYRVIIGEIDISTQYQLN